jgi:leucyl aminopeptidase (aminopeptidase T)
MDYDDEISDTSLETGSDELLSDDNLRLPEYANILVRTHAVQSWLVRRLEENTLEVGEAALALQQVMMQEPQETRIRRRERERLQLQVDKQQQRLEESQQRLEGYLEAQNLLEDCITHTSGERVLVEYYLTLEDLVHNVIHDREARPRLQALFDVQHRVEHVGAPNEED